MTLPLRTPVNIGILATYVVSFAWHCSNNPPTAVGACTDGGTARQAFRWTEAGGIVGLGYPDTYTWSQATGISSDGSIIVGEAQTGAGSSSARAWVWNAVDGFTLLPLPATATTSVATSVSADGTVIVGRCNVSTQSAFIWTDAGGSVAIPHPAGADSVLPYVFVSADGEVVFGAAAFGADVHLWTWTSAGGTVDHGEPDTGTTSEMATGISADGAVLLADAQVSGFWRSFLGAPGAFVELTLPAGGVVESFSGLPGLSDDGLVVALNHWDDLTDSPGFWSDATGHVLLDPYATNTGAFANGISRDGLFVVGDSYGGAPSDENTATIWRIFDPPSSSATFDSTFTALDTSEATLISVLAERILTTDSLTARGIYEAALTESVTMQDAVGVALTAFLAEALTCTDLLTAVRAVSAELADALVASDLVAGYRLATVTMAEALLLIDQLHPVVEAELDETMTAADVLAAKGLYYRSLIEQVLLTDSMAPYLRLTAIIDERIDLSDTLSALGIFKAALAEELVLYGSLRLPTGDEYTVWVMDTKSKAVVEYRDFPFRGYGLGFGTWFGANEFGIYRLEGDDDAGDPINAWVRRGIHNLGTGKMKRMPSLYLGYQSTGQLVLKVITTSDTGAKVSDWYPLPAQTAGAHREGRIKLGRGLKSVFWGFELHNKAGADFELDVVEWFPLILDRRV